MVLLHTLPPAAGTLGMLTVDPLTDAAAESKAASSLHVTLLRAKGLHKSILVQPFALCHICRYTTATLPLFNRHLLLQGEGLLAKHAYLAVSVPVNALGTSSITDVDLTRAHTAIQVPKFMLNEASVRALVLNGKCPAELCGGVVLILAGINIHVVES